MASAVGVDTELLGGTSPNAGEGKLLTDWASPLKNGALCPQSLTRKGFVPESCVLSWAQGGGLRNGGHTEARPNTDAKSLGGPRASHKPSGGQGSLGPQALPGTHSLGHECLQQGSEGLGEVVLLHHVVQCHQGTIQVGNGLDLVFTL